MGLIRAILGATGSVMADQWREYFTCDALSNDVLIAKGEFKTKKRGIFGANNKASEDIITNGSIIAVNEGQMALIVNDGKIVEFCAEPGAFKWDDSTEPSMYGGEFFKGLVDSFKRIGYRYSFGGDLGAQQRVYYVNTKEIVDNKFGTQTPMPYDDPYYKTALYIRYFGQYSFRITDPLVFFSNVAGNVKGTYTRDQMRAICTDEFMTALDTSLALCSAEGIKFSQLPMKQREIARFMSETLDSEWRERRGLEITAVALTKVTPDENSRKRIEEFDTNVMHSDPAAMTGGMAYAQMQAMQKAAGNSAGAMTGFMGFGMANQAMGGAGGQANLLQNAQRLEEEKKAAAASAAQTAVCKNCGYGVKPDAKFCPECGTADPVAADDAWTCTCGHVCQGKFCPECGRKKPTGCPGCGAPIVSGAKFCPECGQKLL